MAKHLPKIGVSLGSGHPPLVWTVIILQFAFDEAMAFLDLDQYRALSQQFQELATQGDPTHSAIVSLDKVEDFYKLRDRGGILHPHNPRISFGIDNDRRRIVVLHALNKRNNGKTPAGSRITARNRWRHYCRGEYE